jgi:hypothetical protein
MALSRALSRCPWIALAATLVAFWIGDGRSASASTAPGRMAQMRRAGCCCPTLPVGGCCCEPAATLSPSNVTTKTNPAIKVISRTTARFDSIRPGSSCQCRSGNPAAPIREPERRGEDRPTDSVAAAIEVDTLQDQLTEAPVRRPITPTANLARSPIYLRTSRLLI